jgi:hypothetical protein
MARVLHLLAEGSDDQARRLSALVARRSVHDVETRTIGRGGTFRSPLQAMLSLRDDLWSFDLLHAWDAKGLAAASIFGGVPVLASLSTETALPTPAWRSAFPRRVMRYTEVVCSTASQRAGVSRQIGSERAHLIEPAVEMDRAVTGRRAAVRARLGLHADHRVILAPGESTRAARHEVAAWMMSILHIIDPRFRLLIAGTGPRVEQARRMAASLRRPEMLCVAADAVVRPDEVLEASDAAVLTATGPVPSLSLAECMAAGLPIVAARGPAVTDLLVDGQTAILTAEAAAPPVIARAILDLLEDAAKCDRLAAAARAEAARRFAPGRLLAAYDVLYERMADRLSPATAAPPAAAPG